MTAPCLISLPGAEHLAASVARETGAEIGKLVVDQFPDGETYLRFETTLKDRPLILLAVLDRPDAKLIALLLAAGAAREQGASSIILAAPYLPYMRQDTAFQPGEAVSACHVAQLLSGAFDGLVTIDPHLHRYASLSEIYSIPTRVLTAAPLLGAWIHEAVQKPLIIGPDEESEQWVRPIRDISGADYLVLRKTRHGPESVEIAVPNLAPWREHQPVIVDDVISTAETMAETARQLVSAGLKPPVCLAVHGIFAATARERLSRAGVARVLTTNTICDETNGIDIGPLLGEGTGSLLAELEE